MCDVPPSKTLLNRADVPGMEEGIRLMDSLVDFLNGNITAPGAFESFIRKVAKNPSAVSESRAGPVPGRGRDSASRPKPVLVREPPGEGMIIFSFSGVFDSESRSGSVPGRGCGFACRPNPSLVQTLILAAYQ